MSPELSRNPVLVAVGQITERDRSGKGRVPVELITDACKLASADGGVDGLLESVSHIATTGLTVDADQVKTPISRGYRNLPRSVAKRLGIKPQRYSYVATGGNTPQYLVNHFAEQISLGNEQSVLLAGGECLATMLAKFDRWYKWLGPKGAWKEDPGGVPHMLGDARASCSKHEAAHGLDLPANVYPLFENALQHHYARSADEHHAALGRLFAGFAEVAAQNPYAWFQQPRTGTELVTRGPDNRMVAYPYTKHLNSMIVVNQAAAVLLTSEDKAMELGIEKDRWVYLHGCADANEIWNVSNRRNFYSAPAMRRCGQEALAMAGLGIDEISHFDIYSCFPSAVQIACDEFGVSHDDPRGLTLTGGLPYFGGPGNNYSMHAIVEMVNRLREHPEDFGLLNANGWYLTKHSLGVYSCQRLEQEWARVPPKSYQAEILAESGPAFTETPDGRASIETFTVLFDREGEPERGIVFGRLDDNTRFLANTPRDKAMMHELCDGDAIGRSGAVISQHGLNTFSLR